MATGSPLSHIVQHPIVQEPLDLGFPFTPEGKVTLFSDHISMILVAGVLLTLVLPPLARRRKGDGEVERMVPTGFGNFIEMICAYFRDELARPALGPHTDRFIKYIWSVFFFILTINLLGLLPIAAVSPLLAEGLHLGGTATANIFVTSALALTTLLMMVINGFRFGGMEYVKHFMPGPKWLAPLMFVVEIIGLLAKPFALAVRLFANMVAGHLLLAVLLSFIFGAASALGAGMGFAIAVPVVLGSIAINMLEIFVAFLQAFIFTFLTTLFIGQSVLLHDEEHEHHDHDGDGDYGLEEVSDSLPKDIATI